MAVSFTNNWKNILDKLQSVIRAEFQGSLPVYKGHKEPAGSTYLQLNPVGSELLEYNVSSETREFTILVQYYYSNKNIKDTALDHILRMVSRTEALIHDNITMTLSDSSTAFNCRFESTELNTGDEEGLYLVEWEWRCQHLSNLD